MPLQLRLDRVGVRHGEHSSVDAAEEDRRCRQEPRRAELLDDHAPGAPPFVCRDEPISMLGDRERDGLASVHVPTQLDGLLDLREVRRHDEFETSARDRCVHVDTLSRLGQLIEHLLGNDEAVVRMFDEKIEPLDAGEVHEDARVADDSCAGIGGFLQLRSLRHLCGHRIVVEPGVGEDFIDRGLRDPGFLRQLDELAARDDFAPVRFEPE